MRVLVIDDEPIIRRALRRVFTQKGHVVLEAENGVVGLTKWRDEDPDVVFLDVIMPEKNGIQVLTEIGNDHRAKVIIISAFMSDGQIEKFSQLKADEFIIKPFVDIFDILTMTERLVHE